jgi:hypothetical protein
VLTTGIQELLLFRPRNSPVSYNHLWRRRKNNNFGFEKSRSLPRSVHRSRDTKTKTISPVVRFLRQLPFLPPPQLVINCFFFCRNWSSTASSFASAGHQPLLLPPQLVINCFFFCRNWLSTASSFAATGHQLLRTDNHQLFLFPPQLIVIDCFYFRRNWSSSEHRQTLKFSLRSLPPLES